MKVVTASPTYGPVDPECSRTFRASVMTAARHGYDFLGDISPDRMSYGGARNMVVHLFLENYKDADGIVWVDSDIVPRVDSIWKLVATAEKFECDFLTGIYHQRRGDHLPCIYSFLPDRDTFRQYQLYDPDLRFRVDGCGFGFVYTSRRLLEAVCNLDEFNAEGGEWFPDRRLGHGKYGEDLGFCKQAMATEFKLWADTGIVVGHMGDPEEVTRETQMKKMAPDGVSRVIEG